MNESILWTVLSGGYLLGIILLDTRFPRLTGDVGNPKTFPFPVLYERVEGALPSKVIRERDPSLLPPFIEAARSLRSQGAQAITTSCGFLAIWQKELASAVRIPVLTSSLMQIPWVHEMMGRKGRIGVFTIDASSLTEDHFKGVGADGIPLLIHGMKQEGEFYRVYAGNNPDLDYQRAEKEVVIEISGLVKENPDVRAIVLECANMSVFRKVIREAAGIPVYDLLTLIHFFRLGLSERER